MNSMIDVSVCITTFQQARYIARCLESVVAQLPPGRIEVLVGDDGSSDGTREIISAYATAYPGIIIPVFHETRRGPSGNYRALINAARGRYIAHLDGDDYWIAGKLARQIEVLDHSHSSAVLTNAWVVDANDQPLGLFTSNTRQTIDLDYLLAAGNFLCHGSLLYRAERKQDILDIPGTFVDYRILVRLAASGTLAYLPELLVVYRWNSAGSMRTHMNALVGQNYWEALCEGLALGASPASFQKGAIRFLEKVFATCLLGHQFGTLGAWFRRVQTESPVSPTVVLAGALGRVPMAAFRAIRRSHGIAAFRRVSIFYRR